MDLQKSQKSSGQRVSADGRWTFKGHFGYMDEMQHVDLLHLSWVVVISIPCPTWIKAPTFVANFSLIQNMKRPKTHFKFAYVLC